MSIYITGDTHGDFRDLGRFCASMGTTRRDQMVVLGDAALNYSSDMQDYLRKREAARHPITYFCIQGNHECRPEHIASYKEIPWHGGMVWQDPEFPRQLFAKDGEIYDLGGKKVIVIGGAYSVDKEVRKRKGYRWFEDEQPSEEIKKRVEDHLEETGWKVDAVFSHTCPAKYIPTEAFLHCYDQDKVDQSTEEWLDSIEERLDYKQWYCGHYHINKRIDRMEFLFHDVRLFSGKKV